MVAFLAATVSSAIAAGSAFGVAQTIVASDPSVFTAATYTMDQGDRPTLQNTSSTIHNARARQNGPDGNDLFSTPTIGSGTTTLDGTQYLNTGTYAFQCTIHPLSMQANLSVSGLGTPVARPDIDVTAAGGKLSKAAKKGKLLVTVKALTKSDDVELTVKLGKATLGTQSPFDLAAGQTRKLSVKLTKSGKAKLADLDRATLKVTGEVPFGSPDTAKTKLK